MATPTPAKPLRARGDAVCAVAATVWKRVQDRMLRGLLVGGAVAAAIAGWVIDFQAGEVRVGLTIVDVFVALLVVFIGSTEIPRDRATRSVQFFLAKPLGRGQYVTGKFLGVLVIGEAIFLVYAACFLAAVGLRGLLVDEAALATSLRLMLHLATLSALVVGLSVFLPEMAATIFGFAFCFASFAVFIVPALAHVLVPEFLHPLALVVYYPLPNAQHFFWPGAELFTAAGLAWAALYTLAYCALATGAAGWWFRRRDLN